jgi:hypothetical protein
MKIRFANILAIAVIALAGCAPKDGLKELDEARSAMELKDYVKAKKYFAKSLEYSPGRVDALVGLVQALLSIGEIDDAAKAIDKAVTLRGEDVDVKLLDAEVAWHQKDYAKAKRIFAVVDLLHKVAPEAHGISVAAGNGGKAAGCTSVGLRGGCPRICGAHVACGIKLPICAIVEGRGVHPVSINTEYTGVMDGGVLYIGHGILAYILEHKLPA